MKVTILSTSDVHGFVLPTDFSSRDSEVPFGLARAATVIAELKAHASDDELVLTIENGDFIQGSPLTNYIAKEDRDEVGLYQQLAKQIGYDARILGNHEFNYGTDYLQTAIPKGASVLNANILAEDGEPFMGKPYRIIEEKGVKVAILGLTTDYIPHWEKPANIAGLQFADVVETAKRYVPILRQEADLVIVAYHGGFEADLKTGEPDAILTGENVGYRLLSEVPGIDGLVTGHQHRQLAGIVQGTPTTQPGYRGDNVGVLTFELDEANAVTKQATQLLPTKGFKPDAGIVALTKGVQAQVEDWLDSPVGQVAGDMLVHAPLNDRAHGDAYLDFINHVQMTAMGTDIAATALFNDEVPGFKPEVTMRDVVTSYIYPNTLAAEKITGADLKAALEKSAAYFTVVNGELTVTPIFLTPKPQHYNYDYWSGVDYTFDLSLPVGQRVTKLKYHGHDVTPDEELVVALNQYRAVSGGDFMMFGAEKIVKELQVDITDLIADYFKEHPVVTAHEPHNLTTHGYSWMKA